MPSEKKTLGILVSFNDGYLSGHPHLKIVCQIMQYSFNDWRGMGDFCEQGQPFLQDLTLSANLYGNSPNLGTEGVCFNEPEFEGRFDIHKMEKALPTLRKVTKTMAKLQEELGSPESFGAHVLRFAKAVGAESILFRTPHANVMSSDWCQRESLSNGSYGINKRIDEWKKANMKAAA